MATTQLTAIEYHLLESSLYNFKVIAVNIKGAGPETPLVSIKTHEV